MRAHHLAATLGMVLVVVACGSKRDSSFDQPAAAPPALAPPGPNLGAGSHTALVAATFSGKVFAPNGTLPMAGVLVYWSAQKPDPIPQGVYCDECVTLSDGTFDVSTADGSFTITTQVPTGKSYIVVQKGQFRRVREINVDKAGDIAIDKNDSTLPGKGDVANGDDVPKMVILKDDADFDKIDESLTKLGITDFEVRTDRTLLQNQAELMKYHVVFVPCGSNTDEISASASGKANMQAFVAAGGKLYVTDWSYEFVRQPFTGFVSWVGEDSTLGSAASGDEWDSPANAQDQGLADWLAATGDATFTVAGNWTEIRSVNTMPGKDPKGNDADITPKVWVTARKGAQESPTTVSFENQCGRVLFSTYHTESGFGGNPTLLAQEKALLYVLLEVGVCVGDRPTTTH
jgi:hypothetical protein